MSDWFQNDDGHWCPACGYLVARSDNSDDVPDDELPSTCKQCGYPDFEDGAVYFTDEEE